ncbi:uncharacterized protein LOC113562126 [Ooceraea biroi]|uniref:uncharacterized protein LOC113562126 n=1 Tax=Ooceraea biroi TaxID=2015173 RepID=UPI000F099B37|nr:uncharacterized protein LOC113562126 [Ooceraea biroi]
MENLTQLEQNIVAQSLRVSNLGEYFAWTQQCDDLIEQLEERSRDAKQPRLSIGNKQSLVARIARLEGLKKRLEKRFIHIGGEYAGWNNGVEELSWREIETAFESRILTGAVINSGYIEPRRFLEDASIIVLDYVQKVINEHDSVKLNTVFNGEFVAGEKTANKSINTRNRALFRTSNLKEWFARYVIEPTLASLEEFQERDSGWALSRILDLTVNVNKYNPMHAGCHVKLPKKIMAKKAVVNVQILNLQGIEFPMTLKQVNKFEELNNVSINIYYMNECRKQKNEKEVSLSIVSLRLTDDKKARHINLLYVPQDNGLGHFTWIKNLSRLVGIQLSSNKRKKYICDRCLHYFSSSGRLKAHSVDCTKLNDCVIVLPKEDDKWLRFDNHSRKERMPFVVYANLECALEKRGAEKFGTYPYHHHKAYSAAYYVRCSYDNSLSAYRYRRGTDCISWFVEELRALAFRVKAILTANVPMENLTREQEVAYHSATHCHICEEPFAQDETRVRDHCHLTGRYRGPAHSNCNLNYKESYTIPIVFHNLSGYDSHFIIKELASVFPYKYVDCAEKLQDTRLPLRESFYSSLTGDTISESDYAHAENIWQQFAIQTLGEYSDLYLKTDVLLLADSFENFRDSCITSYGLDAAYYYTLPDFTWDAMLKHTRINFELLTDIDMVMFIERGIRGSLSQCSNRYARANNKYMESYDPSKPSSYLTYFDINNLYGWAMSQPLPYADFQWVDDVSDFDVNAIAPDSSTGYILEVDLEYPQHLHDAHTDLPFCLTRDKPPGKRQNKLLATLNDKERYVIHYRNLQQCMRHGLRIIKIHRVLQFAQSAWLRRYIELNTQFRMRATNDFEKNLYKLINNAVFGKTMENVRNHMDVKLVTKWNGRYGAEALIAKPNFHSRSVFSENLVAIELRKLQVKFNKPIYVGMCILDIYKTCLYEFHHEYMVPLYREKCKIMYTDMDSLIYHIECDDVYEQMKHDVARFDTSDYEVDNAYGMPLANKKVPGLMKDENNGTIMTEFVGLRAKMYAVRVAGRKDTKKAKGVKSNVVSKAITFEDYTRCLKDYTEVTRRQSCIRSKLHEVYTVSEPKIALSPYDDKR